MRIPPERHDERGMVLLVTLAALAMLIPLVYAGVDAQRFHARQVQRELDLIIARRNAESLLARVARLLIEDAAQTRLDHPGEPWATPIAWSDRDGEAAEAVTQDLERFWNLNGLRLADGQIDDTLRGVLVRLWQREGVPVDLLEGLLKAPLPLRALEQVPGWDRVTVRKMRAHLLAEAECPSRRLNLNTAALATLALLNPEREWQGVIRMREREPFAQVADLSKAGVTLAPQESQLLGVNSACFAVTIRSRAFGATGTLTALLVRDASRMTIRKVRWNG
ncbi:MAG: general secretion pathway protein GspK [Magnetococcales bacterium]|nr:general secretion pathway protein GspK [Magnetococcales bacterium]